MADVSKITERIGGAQDNASPSLYSSELMKDYGHVTQIAGRGDQNNSHVAGLPSADDLLAHFNADKTQAASPSDALEQAAKDLVKAADKEYQWARGEAKRIQNGGQPSNPNVDLAMILIGDNTMNTRVELGDIATQNGDTKGAISAYEEAGKIYMGNEYNVPLGSKGNDLPEDIVDKLQYLGVSKNQAFADIARLKGTDGSPNR